MSYFRTARAFSFADVAKITGVSVDTLRSWNTRNPTEYLGGKQGYRIFFNALDCYFFSLVRDFINFGVPARTAMHTAARFTDEAHNGGPVDGEILLVRVDGEKTEFQLIQSGDDFDRSRPTLMVFPDDNWRVTMERARAIYATEDDR